MATRVPAAALVLGALLSLGLTSTVLGHVRLESSDPAAGSTVSRVDAITLVFDENLREAASSFKLVGPDGATVGTGTATAPRRMTLDTPEGLPPGEYLVRWTAGGEDGHIERGRFSFTLAAAAAAPTPAAVAGTPAPALTPAPTPAAATAGAPAGTPGSTASPSANPGPGPAPAPAASTTDVLVPIVAGLAVVGIVGLLVLRRSRTA